MKNSENLNKSMLDISYEILKKNKKPMSIYKLMEKVFKIKKIDLDNKEKLSQLYIDITLSGHFVFHGKDLWSIKEEYLDLWDKEYFVNSEDESNINIKQDQDEIDKKICNFDDFLLKQSDSEEHNEEEKESELIQEDLYSDFNLENDEIQKKIDFSDEETEVEKEDNIEEYEYLDEENK
ncbi:MAG: DNA-directed RNA polymerase subunit delta [Candidatus Phytoplasma cynodontis]|uniref:DNA-directed RNA polymerase subunit delta n=1 Tax='Cynodon dactylon' phytoplasma TaxID=295320 RepID=UPI001265BFDB|nr:DNA-directed RNA polymerase subunit delta ['Cynodon dactylon' phytoplasma]KAB8121701.1 DNA-directed RNA polymerase subunit delta ['Cynodon dactylon' phytoplasma]WIA07673.1 MAG: DNA-directed RNA polymerase subunit delta [Candidatus Phytoplasma cynodontis]